MNNIYLIILVLFNLLTTSQLVFAQKSEDLPCIERYQNLIKSMKTNEGQFDADVNKYYNLFYYNKDVNGSVPSDLNNFFQEYGTPGSSEYTKNTFKVDINTGIVFLISEWKYSWKAEYNYSLKAFHPIIGPLQIYFDEIYGQLILPKQNKKVSITSRSYSPNLGFTLKVSDDRENNTIETEIIDAFGNLSFLFDKEKSLNQIKDYPNDSFLNSYYGTKKVIDKSKSTEVEVKYFPSYEEKLNIYKAGGFPRQDLENPNFFIIKKQQVEVYKNEVYGRKGSRHFLNDCYEELESSFGTYFIFKRDGKYGILDASWESLKTNNYTIYNNIYDKITWNKGTDSFTLLQNNIISVICLKNVKSDNVLQKKNFTNTQVKDEGVIPNGILETRRKDGDLESRIEYKDGIQNGIYERYYMGKLEIRGEMNLGKQHGRWEYYIDERGKYLNGKTDKKRSGIYENGVKIKNL